MKSSPYRVGPWPGLTPSGAGVLLGCAVLLALTQLLQVPQATLIPLAIATRVINAPGAASATCGAYLLPRSLISLIQPAVELPPLLLVPAMAFDLAWWLRPADFPRRRPQWRKQTRTERTTTRLRGAVAGLIFGAVLSGVQGPSDWPMAAATIAISAAAGAISAPGRAS